jgi:hypothetical protein
MVEDKRIADRAALRNANEDAGERALSDLRGRYALVMCKVYVGIERGIATEALK